MIKIKSLSLVLFIILLNVNFANAADVKKEDSKRIISLVVENDSFSGSDREYTSGVRISALSQEKDLPRWVRRAANMLPLANNGKKRVGVAVGQSIFTPDDITLKTPRQGDRPYAGWLYGSIGMVSDTDKTLDNVMLTLGIVGPSSFAEPTQINLHRAIGSPHPEAWDTQLKDELGVVFTYERKWRAMFEASPFGYGFDVTPHAGVNLGNINTDLSLGATFRLGYDLPADYGPPRVRPSLPGSDFFVPTKKIGGYLFTTIAQRAVARDIFLDGNSFRESNHVEKENFVHSLQMGGAITFGNSRLSYTQVYMSKEYKTQLKNQNFGVLTLSFRF